MLLFLGIYIVGYIQVASASPILVSGSFSSASLYMTYYIAINPVCACHDQLPIVNTPVIQGYQQSSCLDHILAHTTNAQHCGRHRTAFRWLPVKYEQC